MKKSVIIHKLKTKAKGYTLVEMLVVVFIIALLLGVGVTGLKSIISRKGVSAGLVVMKAKVEQTRTKAKGSGVPVRLVIHCDGEAARANAMDRERLFRYVAVAEYVDASGNVITSDRDSTDGTWTVREKGELLPAKCFFDAASSNSWKDGTGTYTAHYATTAADDAAILGDGRVMVKLPGDSELKECYFFEFNHIGIPTNPYSYTGAGGNVGERAARVVLSDGLLRASGSSMELVVQTDQRTYQGFVIARHGECVDFTDKDNIKDED